MLDKDLDKLFKDRFENFETEPSSDLWNKVEGRLDSKKTRKKSFFTLWKAAACIAIVSAAYLWFNKPQKLITLQGKPDAVVIQEPVVKPGSKAEENIIKETPLQNETEKIAAAPTLIVSEQTSRVRVDHPGKKTNIDVINEVSVKATKKQKTKPAIPEIKEVETPVVDNSDNPILIAKTPETETIIMEEETPKLKIKSLGGLVNFVISKVDPREDKIIEFKEGDEGSQVSGINLGLIKLKSKKEKKIQDRIIIQSIKPQQ